MKRAWWGWLLVASSSSCSSDVNSPSATDCGGTACVEARSEPPDASAPDAAVTPPSPELTLLLTPDQLVLKPGSTVDVGIAVTRPLDFTDSLTVAVTNLPPGVSAMTGTIPNDGTLGTFRLSVAANVAQGSFIADVTVRGTSKVVATRLPAEVIGPAGALDTSFGTGGRTTSGVEFVVANLGVQPDGHVVLAGTSSTSGAAPTHDQVAVRFDADGVVDATFGAGGKAVLDFGGGDDFTSDALVQRDGKIVLAGHQYTALDDTRAQTIGRFNADGTVDTTFAGTGKSLVTPAGSNSFFGLHQQPDGKLLAAGVRNVGANRNGSMTRFTAQGSLDPSFGTGGTGILEMGSQDYCIGAATDKSGRIVVAGERFNGVGYDFVAARFTAAGVVDTTFAAPNGWVASVSGVDIIAFAWAVVVQADGKVVIGGSGPGPTVGHDLVVFRYLDDGTPDLGFGTNGKAALDVGDWDRIYRVASDDQNRIVFVGESSQGPSGKAVVGRLLPNGQPDVTFGRGGLVLLDFSPDGGDFAEGLALLPDGRMLIGGHSVESTKRVPWVAKLWP